MFRAIPSPINILLFFLSSSLLVSAQFGNIFEHMFQGQQQQQQHHQARDVPSDSSWYQNTHNGGMFNGNELSLPNRLCFFLNLICRKYTNARSFFLYLAQCSLYLCPGTLACVSQPTHCPCAFPAYEEKYELSDGSAICVSKMGKRHGTEKKIMLARKGLL